MAKVNPVTVERIVDSIDSFDDINDLNEIIARATARRDGLVSTKTREFWDRVSAEAAAAGLDPADVLALGKQAIKPVRSQGGMYRHPQDPTLKWVGQGRMPKWCHEYIEAHGEDAFHAECKVKDESESAAGSMEAVA